MELFLIYSKKMRSNSQSGISSFIHSKILMSSGIVRQIQHIDDEETLIHTFMNGEKKEASIRPTGMLPSAPASQTKGTDDSVSRLLEIYLQGKKKEKDQL